MKNNYKVLVLGAGLIGSEVSAVCNDLGYENMAVDIVNADIKIDLTDEKSLTPILEEFKPNAIFNTAGVDQKLGGMSRKLHEMDNDEWNDIFNTNTTITLNVAKQVISYFINSNLKIKKLIYTPSTYSFTSPNPKFYDDNFIKSFAYVGSKTIEVDIVKYIARYYAKDEILCNGLVPHLVLQKNKDFDESFVPLGRSCDPKELHPAIKILIDPNNTFMTGEFIKINGGWLS
tara:strand:- start:687 stop:1379 length:693 start_codon:yes stop_codon:yes gene_type:complete